MVSNFFDNQNEWKYANGVNEAPKHGSPDQEHEVKLAKCEAGWVKEVGSVTRFASEEAGEKSKREYIEMCITKEFDEIIMNMKKKVEPKGLLKNTQVQQGLKNVQKTFKNPFAEGFKKYVVTEDFLATSLNQLQSGTGRELPKKQFKKGMNLFAKETQYNRSQIPEPYTDLVSYGGFVIDKTKVKEKNPNVYERIQSFFTIKKGF